MSQILPLIEAIDLNMRFGAKTVLDSVSLRVPAGSITGLLGPNGAGKTTTMRILTGCLKPSAGKALICNFDLASNRLDAQTQLGYLPEAAGGFNHLTPTELLRYCGEARGLNGAALEHRIEELYATLDVADEFNLPLRLLSKGWRQRAWLAQSLLHDPPVLVLDEPTDGLDPNQKRHLRDLIKRRAQDKAILLSTHILEEAEWLCDRIVLLNRGRVIVDDEIGKLVDENHRLADSFGRLTLEAE